MYKSLTAAGIIVLVLFLSVSALAGEGYVEIEKAVTDSGPAYYLIDGHVKTAWSPEAWNNPAWAKIKLEDETFIEGIEIEGNLPYDTEAVFEYRKDGNWYPFLSPSIIELKGKKLVDLSYDQVSTESIRMKIRGKYNVTSQINELKVLGTSAEEKFRRLNVESLEQSGGTDSAFPVQYMVDGNTRTMWKTRSSTGDAGNGEYERAEEEIQEIISGDMNSNTAADDGEVIFNFNSSKKLDEIYMYFTPEVKGDFYVYADKNGSWQQIGMVGENSAEVGWHKLDLSSPGPETNRIKISVEGSAGELGGIGEVCFFGRGSSDSRDKIIIGGQKEKEIEKPLTRYFEIEENKGSYFLEIAAAGNDNDSLEVEVNGQKHTLKSELTIRGATIYRKEIESGMLREGDNSLRIVPGDDKLRIFNTRLSRAKRKIYRSEFGPEELNDGLNYEDSIDDSEIDIDLNKNSNQLPEYPGFPEVPSDLEHRGNREINNGSGTEIIDEDGHYDYLNVNTELVIETGGEERTLVIDDLQLGTNGSISIAGGGEVNLFILSDLILNDGSKINPSGDKEALNLYHSGDRIDFQGSSPETGTYKFCGFLQTKESVIDIRYGADINADIYARRSELNIIGGLTSGGSIFNPEGEVLIDEGADVEGQILSEDGKITVTGGSTYDSGNDYLMAPGTDVEFSQGAIIRGEIRIDPALFSVLDILKEESDYSVTPLGEEENYTGRIKLYSTENNPSFNLLEQEGNSQLSEDEYGLKSVSFQGNNVFKGLTVENSSNQPLSEVDIDSFAKTSGSPEVKILKPLPEKIVSTAEVSDQKVIGFVDNPEAEIRVNGKEVYKRGHHFWLPLNHLEVYNRGKVTLEVEAVDSLGRKGEFTEDIFVLEEDSFTVDNAGEITYTESDKAVISGEIKSPLDRVEINGEQTALNSGQFNKEIELEQGLNRIKITAFENGSQCGVKYRDIIYTADSPVLTVNSPLTKYFTNQNEIIISGYTGGNPNYRVEVMGREASTCGMYYVSEPIELTDGENTIPVTLEAGDVSQEEEVTVVRDTTPPELQNVLPEDESFFASKEVEVSGDVVEDYPASLTVNGNEIEISDGKFSDQIQLPGEGENQLIYTVADRAGNVTERENLVTVDTQPPEDFTPEADPADWTDNPRPEISFETEDKISGISHYELAVDDGEFTEVESPYKLPELEDGEHTVTVKAVNNAGLATKGETEVFIDTTSPEAVKDFRAVPGAEDVEARWSPAEEDDVVEYRLYRNPGWQSGDDEEEIDYKVITPDELEGDEFKFLDTATELGEEYTYYLQAVDHAGNIGEATEESSVKVGIARQEIDPGDDEDDEDEDEDGEDESEKVKVEYIGAEVEMEKDSVPEKGTVEITETDAEEEEDLPGEPEGEVVSRTRSFEYKDKDGELIRNIRFEEDAEITLWFDEDIMPEGIPLNALEIHYYSEPDGRWIRLDKEDIDLDENKITAKTNHFSAYNVQINENFSPAEEEYEDIGVSPYKTYFKNRSEKVSPTSGNLTVEENIISLPGRNDLDLELGLIHDYNLLVMDNLKSGDPSVYDSFGRGWNINLPRIEDNDRGQFIYFETGDATKIDWKQEVNDDSAVCTSNEHEGRHFYAEKEQVSDGNVLRDIFEFAVGKSWKDQNYVIITKDGVKYDFDGDGKLQKITDSTGNNVISVSYNGDKINNIVDSVGRRIDFTYSGDKISYIELPGDKTYEFKYSGDKLKKIIDPLGRVTSYGYKDLMVKSGGSSSISFEKYGSELNQFSSNIEKSNVPFVEEIVYPTNGVSNYDMSVRGVEGSGSSTGTEDIRVGEGLYEEVDYKKSWEAYNYTTVTVDEYYKNVNLNNEKDINYKNYEYDFNQEDGAEVSKADLRDPFRIENTKTIEKDKTINISVDDQRLMEEKKVLDNDGDELEKYKYGYNSDLKAVAWERVYKEGEESSVYSRSFEYDNWGNVVKREHTGTGEIEYYHYYNTDSKDDNFRSPPFKQGDINKHIHDRPAGKIVHNSINRDGSPSIQLQETAYQYDEHGNLKTEAVNHKDPETDKRAWIKTKYNYDKYGNLKEEIGPEGARTEITYGEEYEHAYPTVIERTGPDGYIEDADGERVSSVVEKKGYDFTTGEESWEIDPRGNLTEYEHDDLGRLVKIIYPDDNDLEDVADPDVKELHPDDYLQRDDNPVKLQKYNDDEGYTTIVNTEENISLESDLTLTEEGPVFNKSRYHYDGLDNWVKLEQYLLDENGNEEILTTEFRYDSQNRRYLTIDAEGKVTAKEFDPLDRDKAIYYPGEDVDPDTL
ncbi:MAG: discoidin domain-containing protein, partial [Bacillota bacterium]